MFKCYDCLKDKSLTMISLPSYGPCEICKKTKQCYDVHGDNNCESKQEQL